MNERKLMGKVAIVTGAAQGIGKATALALAKKGAIVYCLDIQDIENQKTAEEASILSNNECYAMHCDVSNCKEVDIIFNQIINKCSFVDILINNAAVFRTMSFIKDSYEDAIENYEYNMNTNTRGTFLCSKKVAPIMAEKGFGDIININTNHVKRYLFSVSKNEHCYDASKYAQMSLTESMACELKPYGVRVNAICPAATRTPMLNKFFKPSDLPLSAERIGKATRIPSLIEAEDVAEAICGMLCWPQDAPTGKSFLVMFSKDCEKLANAPVEEFCK